MEIKYAFTCSVVRVLLLEFWGVGTSNQHSPHAPGVKVKVCDHTKKCITWIEFSLWRWFPCGVYVKEMLRDTTVWLSQTIVSLANSCTLCQLVPRGQ